MTLGIVNVSSRGQIVIPEKIRKSLNIREGSKLIAIEKNGMIMLRKDSDVIEKLEQDSSKEESGWLALAEKSLNDIWDNKKDEKTWRKYLND